MGMSVDWKDLTGDGLVINQNLYDAAAITSAKDTAEKNEKERAEAYENALATGPEVPEIEKFTFDPRTSPLMQHYEKTYMQNGQRAMKDTMANAAFLTGGYGNSYAQQVGQQVYNGYMDELSGKVQELYDAALGVWVRDRDEAIAKYEKAVEDDKLADQELFDQNELDNEADWDVYEAEVKKAQEAIVVDIVEQIMDGAVATDADIEKILKSYEGIFADEDIFEAVKTVRAMEEYYKGENDRLSSENNTARNAVKAEIIEELQKNPAYATDGYITARLLGSGVFVDDEDLQGTIDSIKDAVPEEKIINDGKDLTSEMIDEAKAAYGDGSIENKTNYNKLYQKWSAMGYDVSALDEVVVNEYVLNENGDKIPDEENVGYKMVPAGTAAKNARIDEVRKYTEGLDDKQKEAIEAIAGREYTLVTDTKNRGGGIDRNDIWSYQDASGKTVTVKEADIMRKLKDAGLPKEYAIAWVEAILTSKGEQ